MRSSFWAYTGSSFFEDETIAYLDGVWNIDYHIVSCVLCHKKIIHHMPIEGTRGLRYSGGPNKSLFVVTRVVMRQCCHWLP